jgi:DNA mismatch repair protein MSH6
VYPNNEKELHRSIRYDSIHHSYLTNAFVCPLVVFAQKGKFYELFHMDADVGAQVLNLKYMKGHVAHSGFPESAYGTMADKLVRAGYKVARVEQTETPDMLKGRKASSSRGSAPPKVVNREVCSVMTIGTRTFCYLDDTSTIDSVGADHSPDIGPLLAIREIILEPPPNDDTSSSQDDDDQQQQNPVSEYGITIVDAVRGSVTLGQFADDVLRSRMATLLTAFAPSEVRFFSFFHPYRWNKKCAHGICACVCVVLFVVQRYWWKVVTVAYRRLFCPCSVPCSRPRSSVSPLR